MPHPYMPEQMLPHGVPHHLVAGLMRYVEQGVATGGGLASILTDERLSVVMARCDGKTAGALPSIYAWLTYCAPDQCWGSPTKVATWIETKGLVGRGGT